MKRAAIYVRVSTEQQDEKVSPEEQLIDCQELAGQRDYQIVEVYKDIGSATSTKDRPSFLQLLEDAGADQFDILLAWREDRLYRGYMDTGFIDLMRLVKAGTIEIELVKDQFNQTMAVIKAAMAEEENRARVDRTHMGMKARLRSGKTAGTEQFLGYSKDREGYPIVEEAEAAVVAMIWDWYDQGVGVRDIQRRLIEQGVPQKRQVKVSVLSWKTGSIYAILRQPVYATGRHVVKRDGSTYEIPVPPIREMAQYDRIQAKLKRNRNDKARNIKHPYLVRELLVSDCGGSWGAYTRKIKKKWRKKSTGEVFDYLNFHSVYYCRRKTQNVSKEAHDGSCPITVSAKKVDAFVWNQVAGVLKDPELLQKAVDAELQKVQESRQEAAGELKRLRGMIDAKKREKEAHIDHFARLKASGVFTEDDLVEALQRVAEEERRLEIELQRFEFVASSDGQDLQLLANGLLADIAKGIEWLEDRSDDPEIRHRQFEEKRRIVKVLVDQVYLARGKDPKPIFKIPLQVGDNSIQVGEQSRQYGPARCPAGRGAGAGQRRTAPQGAPGRSERAAGG